MKPNPQHTAGIWLSPALTALSRTPAEKLLLAYLCQRAGSSNGVCTDGNKELGDAVGMHPQTISGLVDRLQKGNLLSAVVETERANKRTLTPVAHLLTDYMPIAHSQSVPAYAPRPGYKSTAHSSPSTGEGSVYPARLCPITGFDITHQGENYPFITASTVKQLFKYDRPRFNQIAASLELVIDADASVSTACLDVNFKVKQIAGAYPPEYFMRRDSLKLPRPQTRLCPTTGVDITHQRANCLFVTKKTIEALFHQNRSRFDALVAELLTPEQASESMGARLRYITLAARKGGKAVSSTE